MSLTSAMLTGVAALDANSQAMSITSSNIANVNTVGYKDSEADFSTFLTSAYGSSINEASVLVNSQQNVTQQGVLQAASSTTDLGIQGNGFFVTSQSPTATNDLYYTRAGNFAPDSSGDLVNGAGYYLLGYPITTAGSTTTTGTSLQPINVSNLEGSAVPSTEMTLQANLESSATVDSTYTPGDMTNGVVTPDFTRTINVYDSQGGSQPLDVSFIKTGANTWSYEVSYQGAAANISPATNPIATGTMTFNADGTLANANSTATPPTGNVSLTIPFASASGLNPQTISLNMGTVGSSNGVTQYDSPSTLTSAGVNGAPYGSLTGVTIGTGGVVTAQYSNGLSQNVYQLPLATFANPDGLNAVTGNAYQASESSGAATINDANSDGSGTIQSSSLESSTVDLATEFTNLITTQRAYSAASRIVTTADTMLQTLEQLPST
jgi:flagellar hook protein FlgE